MIREDSILPIGELPFIVRTLETSSNRILDLPDSLPFAIRQDSRTGAIRQANNPIVTSALDKAYFAGAEMSGMMESENIGADYAQDFLNFCCRANEYSSMRILEIGCGTGYLLSRFQNLGGTVMGIEPGAHGLEGAQRNGVEIVRDFFPSRTLAGKFDYIVLYCVLEHIEHLEDFFKSLNESLKVNGKLLIAVPDCEESLLRGDPSCFLHQHWSYFSSLTLSSELANAGFSATVVKSNFGGLLYAEARKSDTVSAFRQSPITLDTIADASRNSLGKLKNLVSHVSTNSPLGIYPANRALNALSLLKLPTELLFLYDDNPMIEDTYYPGFANPVLPIDRIVDEKPGTLWIASDSFSAILRKKASHFAIPRLLEWKDVFC